MFDEVFVAPELDMKAIQRWFHPDYRQIVGDTELDRDGFATHVSAQKEAVSETKVTWEHLVEEGDSVASVHIIDAVKRDGSTMAEKVIAYWEFEDDRIIRCDELTHLLSGSAADRDLGSRA